MRIYIFRHGVAVDAADPAAPELDADRPLTADGTERTRMALHGLISMGAVVDRIWTSPYVRCVQTAQLAAEVLGVPRMSIEKLTEMEPGGDPASLLARLPLMHDDGVMLIGHSPSVDQMLCQLLGLAEPITALKKAGLAVLQQKSGMTRAKLLGLYEPKTLRRMGRVE
jgi:phosphohistidine phosphatase